MAALAATPGPANLFAVANGLQRGRAAALTAALGMNAATLVWFGAAALGLGALVSAAPQVFRAIAYAGGVYVAWLGVQALRAALRPVAEAESTGAFRLSSRGAFLDGFAVQIANPKIVLFFAAVLPPFMAPDRPAPPQLALFAAGTIGLDMLTMSAYGLGGAALSAHMRRPKFRRAFSFFTATLLLAAAALILIGV